MHMIAQTTQPSLTVLTVLPFIFSSASILVAIISLTVALRSRSIAYQNFRLSRFPSVLTDVRAYHRMDFETTPSTDDQYLEVEVESRGLPIWDMRVCLVGLYEPGEANVGLLRVVMNAKESLPNPMAPGQVTTFVIPLKSFQSHPIMQGCRRKLGFSQLPHDRVSIVLYGSGGREIERIKPDKFPHHFASFERLDGTQEIGDSHFGLMTVNLFEDKRQKRG